MREQLFEKRLVLLRCKRKAYLEVLNCNFRRLQVAVFERHSYLFSNNLVHTRCNHLTRGDDIVVVVRNAKELPISYKDDGVVLE